jgi:hypothetical protein
MIGSRKWRKGRESRQIEKATSLNDSVLEMGACVMGWRWVRMLRRARGWRGLMGRKIRTGGWVSQ